MTQEQNATQETAEQKIDGRTKRALDTAIAKRQVSQESYRAVLEGRIDLKTAKDLGREGSPYGPAKKTVSKNDRSRPCLCGCQGTSKTGRFVAGHDQRMVTYAKEYVRGERDLTPEQMGYVQESGKLERAKRKVSEEERKRREKIEAKAQKQREKEGEAERRRVAKKAGTEQS